MYSVLSNDLNVQYVAQFYDNAEADALLKEFEQLPFYLTTLNIHGRTFTPARKVIAFGDEDVSYSFSGTTIYSEPWTPTLLGIKQKIEKSVGATFNYVLINLYPDGFAKIGHHRDNESDLSRSAPIAVLSLGAKRTLEFKRPNHPTKEFQLDHGSLYVMRPPTNELYTHGIPTEPSISEARISLTFRQIRPTVDEPTAKKRKTDDPPSDDTLPSNDWLEKIFRNGDTAIRSWNFDETLCATLFCNVKGLRLRIREYVKNNESNYLPTKKGILMYVPTWDEFTTKLANFNFKYKDASFIANNQLAVFMHNEQCCVLQQIFKDADTYNLKYPSLKMDRLAIEKLQEIVHQINECMIESLFKVHLPMHLNNENPCSSNSHITSVEAKENIFYKCYEEICFSLKDLCKCYGCIVENCSQLNHSCITLREGEKYSLVRLSALLQINMFNVARNLQSSCSCNYTRYFFENLCVKEFEDYVDSQFKL